METIKGDNTCPIVSICCITYNQANYIENAIEGFLLQKTSFPIEIIIHDDASTDGTATIIKDYANKYPLLITAILQKENQYSKRQGSIYARFVYPHARGKYIALCEGDDYWTDPYKLHKQVNFMESNPGYSLCFHNALFWDHTKGVQYPFRKSLKQVYQTKDVILSNWFCPTASILFRRSVIPDLPKNARKIVNGDLLLLFVASLHGPLYYLNETMSVYNFGVPGSISINLGKKYKILPYKNKLYFLSYINRLTSNRFILYIGARQIYTLLALVKHILEVTVRQLRQPHLPKPQKI